MARDDDDFEEDRPRKSKRRDDDEIAPRPKKSKRRDDDEFEDDRPKRSRRNDDDDDDVAPRKKPKQKSKLPMILGIIAAVLLLACGGGVYGIYFLYSKGKEKLIEVAGGMQSQNDLKQVGLGAMLYADRHEGLPTNSYDVAGRPLLSWRVHLLPFINEEGLYRQFKLDEPWDSPNNKPLLSKIPRLYLPGAEAAGKAPRGTKTYFRAFSSPGALMDPKFKKQGRFGSDIGPKLTDIRDGMSNTILFIEAGEAVEWTKPDDLNWAGGALPPVGGDRKGTDKFFAIFADGSIRQLPKTISPDQLKAAITFDGKDFFNLP